MKIIDVVEVGDLRKFVERERPDPNIEEDEVLIKVHATVVNGSDVIARQRFCSKYPRSYVGLECSGIIEKIGLNVKVWNKGDEVCAILCGGGYAEKVVVHESHIFRVPKNVSLCRAASYPHASCVAWSELFSKTAPSPFFWLPANGKRERLSEDKSFLVHEDGDGICDLAMQIANDKNVNVCVAYTSEMFHKRCDRLDIRNIDQRTYLQTGSPNSYDVILSNLGPDASERHISSLSSDGVVINMSTCLSDSIDHFGAYPSLANKRLPKRVIVQAASFLSRSQQEKSIIVSDVTENIWSRIHLYSPYVHDQIYPFSKVEDAHSLMKEGECGKILLVPDDLYELYSCS